MSSMNVQLKREDNSPWGFRLQGGKDFSTPLSIQKVYPGSLAEQSGLMSGDAILKIQGHNTDAMKHKEAQDTIVRAGNCIDMLIQRGGVRVWKPTGTPINDLLAPTTTPPTAGLYTKTSLAAKKQESNVIGSKHNVSPRPFSASLGGGKMLINNQYNTPAPLYSKNNYENTLSAHTEVIAPGVKSINFMKEDPPVNKESAVYRMIMEENEGHEVNHVDASQPPNQEQSVIRHVSAPVTKLSYQTGDKPLPPNACAECRNIVVGVFVQIKDKNLHPECFKCSTCGTSLKNVGYYNVNDKLYCDAHTQLAAKIAAVMPTVEPLVISKPLSPVLNVTSPTPNQIETSTPNQFQTSTPSRSMSPSAYRTVSPVPFHKGSDIHQVEAPQSPQTTPIQPPFKPMAPVSAPSQVTFKNTTPFSPSSGAPAPRFTTPITSGSQTPSSVPSVPSSHITTTGPDFVQSGVAMNSDSGSKAVPKRGQGQMKQQVGQGAKIPICNICGTPIRGSFLLALGKSWCPDHFICANSQCHRSLVDVGFVEERGQLHCENCYEAHLAPSCSKCLLKIKGDCLNALDKQWHPNCFVCAYCHKPFGNSSFYVEDGRPYCEKDWNELFTTKCVGCGFPIEAGDRWVEALNNNYHTQCFRCTMCNKGLEGQSFYAKSGKPFCKAHSR